MIAEIWRYPVKSCGGELLDDVEVGSAGLDRDRAWAVVDPETGLVASAKRPATWGGLLALSANTAGDQVRVVFPDGQTIATDDREALDRALSSSLGRGAALRPAADVGSPTIERTDPDLDSLFADGTVAVGETTQGPLGAASPPGTVFDFAPVHLLSTATLDALNTADDHTGGDVRRFRPNLVLDIDGPPFQENDWPGRSIVIGSDLVLDVIIQTPRCVVPTLAQPDLPRSTSTLGRIARLNRLELDGHGVFACAGAYASVGRAGRAVVGAEVSVEGPRRGL